jgi:RHS repeat-associated protein
VSGIGWGVSTPNGNVYNSKNQVGTSPYDASGNISALPPGYGFSYDAESRVYQATNSSGPTANYYYDGLGERVEKTVGSTATVLVYDAFGNLAEEYSPYNAWSKDYVFFGGQASVIENASANPCGTCYLSRDYLGTIRLITDASTNVITRHDYLPFGDEIPAGSAGRGSQFGAGADNVNEKFTGQYRDTETLNDAFPARYYTAPLMRFLTPDPASLAAVDPSDPQTWNQYVYVRNNPLAITDPNGANWLTDLFYELGSFFSDLFGAQAPPGQCAALVCVTVYGQPSSSSGNQSSSNGSGPPLTFTPVATGGPNTQSGATAGSAQPPSSAIGIRNPGQSFRGCMQQHANDYNIGGSAELLADLSFNNGIGTSYSSNPVISFFTGDAITSLAFGSTSDASSVAANAARGVVRAGMGAVTTYGRRTSTIMSLNLVGNGGLPQALSQSGAAASLGSTLSRIGSAVSLGLKASTRWAVDAAFTGAEMVNCSMTY